MPLSFKWRFARSNTFGSDTAVSMLLNMHTPENSRVFISELSGFQLRNDLFSNDFALVHLVFVRHKNNFLHANRKMLF